jgi:hypothetical protein
MNMNESLSEEHPLCANGTRTVQHIHLSLGFIPPKDLLDAVLSTVKSNVLGKGTFCCAEQ